MDFGKSNEVGARESIVFHSTGAINHMTINALSHDLNATFERAGEIQLLNLNHRFERIFDLQCDASNFFDILLYLLWQGSLSGVFALFSPCNRKSSVEIYIINITCPANISKEVTTIPWISGIRNKITQLKSIIRGIL